MHDKKEKKVLRAKSFTSIYDIFGPHPFNNVFYRNPNKANTDVSVYQATCGDTENKNSVETERAAYVTSEGYHFLNKDISYNSVVRSTSTIFYDLDDIAKRQSFHCFVQLTPSKENLYKDRERSIYRDREKSINGFLGKSNLIVQECATQIRPKGFPRDSMVINSKKMKHRKFPNDLVLSSEIYLRDNEYELYNQNRCYDREITDRQQKFWSYAKYRTEYTKPIPEEKKSKKKDRGKRTEDPCPCQLFSYACPCTDKKKSLTELAKNSKSLTVAEQVTSTLKMVPDGHKPGKTNWKHKQEAIRVCKVTNTSFDKNAFVETILPKNEQNIQNIGKQEVCKAKENNQNDKSSNQNKGKISKKSRQVICPNCKEKVDICSSTEEEEGSKLLNFKPNEVSPTAAYTYKSAVQNPANTRTIDEEDCCSHEPRCELVPVCQLLPESYNTRCTKKQPVKPTPRIIRITKACRHHPPCTVVPSCQRENVLKNNCEYIPPCLHRPRCVNLPLCVPNSKTVNIDDLTRIDTTDDSVECPHIPKCRYVPECQNDSIDNSSVAHKFNIAPQIQNACEFVNKYHFLHPDIDACLPTAYSPRAKISPIGCGCTKSCQYNCSDCKYNILKESTSDAVIFIRDVGCQFRNKNYSPKDSLVRSKTSSVSFEYLDDKIGNYFTDTQIHTLRCEDKFTSTQSRDDLYESSEIISSTEIDSNCPSHGHRVSCRARQTGFIPKDTSPFIAFNVQNDGVTSYHASKTDGKGSVIYVDAGNMQLSEKMSRRSFLKGKCRKMFAVKRRRKSRASSHVISCCSRKVICRPNAV